MLIKERHSGNALPNSDKFTDRLLRLPMYYELDVVEVVNKIVNYAEKNKLNITLF